MSVKLVESFVSREVRVKHTKSKQLPSEILCNIFRYLDGKSLTNAASVSYRWKSICQKDSLLRKRIFEHLQLTSRKSRIQAIYDKDVTVNLNKHRISQIPLEIAKKLMLNKTSDYKPTPLGISNGEIKSNPFKRNATRPKRMSTTLKTDQDVTFINSTVSLPVFNYDTDSIDCVINTKPKISKNVSKDNLKASVLKKLFYPSAIKKSKYTKLSNDSTSSTKRLFCPDPISKINIKKTEILYSDMDRSSIVTKGSNLNRSVEDLSSLTLSLAQQNPQKSVRIHPIGPTFLLMLKRKSEDLQMPPAKRIKI